MASDSQKENLSVSAYDFDGTITTRDSLFEFLGYTFGKWRLRFELLLLAPWLVAMKLKLIPSGKAKERLLRRFLRGMSSEDFRKKCDAFAEVRGKDIMRPQAIESIRNDFANGRHVAIVSASVSDWVRPFFARSSGDKQIDVLCTELEIIDGRLTGKFATPNCRGEEKVRRLEAFYGSGLSGYLYAAYGDTKGDLPMLNESKHPHYKPWR